MADQHIGSTRTIIAHTLYSNNGSGGLLGYVKPIAELINDELVPVTPDTFCASMKVFITSQYDELEKKYPNHEFFKLDVAISERLNDLADQTNACKYVSTFRRSEPIKPKEFFEVVKSHLPDANDRSIDIARTMPGTRYIFIDDDTAIYGPFKWSHGNDFHSHIKLEFIDSPLPGVKLAPFQIYKIEQKEHLPQVILSHDNAGDRYLLQGLSILSSAAFHDYASDDEVVRYCSKLAADNNVKIIEKSKIDSLATYLLKTPKLNVPLIKQRLARLPEIATTINDVQESVIDSLSSYLKSENGKEIVAKYVEKNESQFIDMLKKEREAELNQLLEPKRDEIRLAEARLKELNESKVALSVEVEEIRKATKQEVILDSARADADNKIKQKKLALAEIERTISEKSSLAEGLLQLENIQHQIAAAEQNQKYAWKRESELKSTIDNLQSQLSNTEDALRKKLTELKPFVEAINGSFAPGEVIKSEIAVQAHEFNSNDLLVVRQRTIIKEAQAKLAARGRVLTDWQIANILISTQQSFISFLAGLPGVGKTSLARLLADLQGIKPRLQEISVARGWTSQKDLIGFFNPLTSRFQPSNTGLYSFLLALSNEKKDQSQAMAYVLLDEANLSPIEHYWSAFMGMSDGEGDRALLFGQQNVQVADCLRFIATINYDGTTEPLSPRIVDRSPVIVIEPSALEDSQLEAVSGQLSQPLPISALQMQELFGNEAVAPDLEGAEKSTFEKIKRTLLANDPNLGRSISISPRKELAIRQYCNKARGIMNAETDFLALDVAVLQHILPLVRGSGPRFAKRLETLRRDLESSGLPKSSEYVSRMISIGEIDLHTYDFFCW